MLVKIKKLHPNAIIPAYSKKGDAGMDLVAMKETINDEYGYIEYGTGLSIEIPEGYVGLIFPRSSISKTFLNLANCVGVIDSGYRGEITLRFMHNAEGVMATLYKNKVIEKYSNTPIKNEYYVTGDKIGQLIIMPYPQITFEEVKELSSSERGEGGYGSTGK